MTWMVELSFEFACDTADAGFNNIVSVDRQCRMRAAAARLRHYRSYCRDYVYRWKHPTFGCT